MLAASWLSSCWVNQVKTAEGSNAASLCQGFASLRGVNLGQESRTWGFEVLWFRSFRFVGLSALWAFTAIYGTLGILGLRNEFRGGFRMGT